MKPVDFVLPKLSKCREISIGHGGECRWQFSCPGPNHKHGDRNPSAVMSETTEGVLLFFCAAGCDFYRIMEGLGLKPSDAFPSGSTNRVQALEGFRINYKEALQTTYHEAMILVCAASDAVNGNLTPADADRITLAAGRILRAYKQSGLKA